MWFSLRLLLVHILRIYFAYLFLSLISWVPAAPWSIPAEPIVMKPSTVLFCDRICRLHASRCCSPTPTPQHLYNKTWQLGATLYIKLPATRFSLLMLSLNHSSVTPIQCCQVSLLTCTATTVTTNVPNVTPSLFSSSTTQSKFLAVQVPSLTKCHADPILSSSITSSIQTPSVTPIVLSRSSDLQIQAPIAPSVTPFTLSSSSTPSRKAPSVLRFADSTVQF